MHVFVNRQEPILYRRRSMFLLFGASAIAVAVNQQLEPVEGASTVELKLNYLRGANEGTLRATGQIIQKGRKIVVAQGEIKNDAGQMLAFGTATFMITQVAR